MLDTMCHPTIKAYMCLAGVGVVVGGAVGENMVIGHVQLSVEYTPWVFFPTADYSG